MSEYLEYAREANKQAQYWQGKYREAVEVLEEVEAWIDMHESFPFAEIQNIATLKRIIEKAKK